MHKTPQLGSFVLCFCFCVAGRNKNLLKTVIQSRAKGSEYATEKPSVAFKKNEFLTDSFIFEYKH